MGFEQHYSEDSFWEKVGRVARKAGRTVIEPALLLYYAFPKVPITQKMVVIGALGYFISPIDLISDMIIGLGYTDDALVLTAAVKLVIDYIDDDVRERVKEKLAELGLD